MNTFLYLGSYTAGYELAYIGGEPAWRWIGDFYWNVGTFPTSNITFVV